jgi:hypothetical protein
VKACSKTLEGRGAALSEPGCGGKGEGMPEKAKIPVDAWRSNKGAAGVDQITLRSIEERGVMPFLEGIRADLKAGRYRPRPPAATGFVRRGVRRKPWKRSARRATGDTTSCSMQTSKATLTTSKGQL